MTTVERAFATAKAWSTWLAKNYSSSRGLWLKIAKSDSAAKSVSYPDALNIALAWGWIDGQKRSFDDCWWLQRFSPRTSTSRWSKINCVKAEALIASGIMQGPGLAEIERAKRDGRWAHAYDGSRVAAVPADLAAALDADASARDFFDGLDRANRYAILYRVQAAKKPETRAKLIAKFVVLCRSHRTLHPRQQKEAGVGAKRKKGKMQEHQ